MSDIRWRKAVLHMAKARRGEEPVAPGRSWREGTLTLSEADLVRYRALGKQPVAKRPRKRARMFAWPV